MAENILLDVKDGVARITLNRPDAANGLTLPMARELMQAAIQCDENSSVRAIVVTGAGVGFRLGRVRKRPPRFRLGDVVIAPYRIKITYPGTNCNRFR